MKYKQFIKKKAEITIKGEFFSKKQSIIQNERVKMIGVLGLF